MNQYTGVSINPEAVITVLAEAYPKTLSMTTLQGKLHAGRPRIESGLMVLSAQGRIVSSTINTVATVYRLSEDEAEKHGFKRENPVRNNLEPVYSRPSYKPPSMEPARSDANDFIKVFSRRGDDYVPQMTPIHMGSNIPGGMA